MGLWIGDWKLSFCFVLSPICTINWMFHSFPWSLIWNILSKVGFLLSFSCTTKKKIPFPLKISLNWHFLIQFNLKKFFVCLWVGFHLFGFQPAIYSIDISLMDLEFQQLLPKFIHYKVKTIFFSSNDCLCS